MTKLTKKQLLKELGYTMALEDAPSYKLLLDEYNSKKKLEEVKKRPKKKAEKKKPPTKLERIEATIKFANDQGLVRNEFTGDYELPQGQALEDSDYNTLYIDAQKNMEIPERDFRFSIRNNRINSYDPIEQWISQNKTRSCKGALLNWTKRFEVKDHNVGVDAVSYLMQKWYVSLIYQVLEGTPNEFFLALISEKHGLGKTRFLRHYTIPTELDDYVSFHSIVKDDTLALMMAQNIMIVDDELDGRVWQEMRALKDLMSSRILPMRRKYDRELTRYARRASFAGTANDPHILIEEENRRIVPVHITEFYSEGGHPDPGDVFIDAYNQYKTGKFPFYYLKGDEKVFHAYNDGFRKFSTLTDAIDRLFAAPDENSVFPTPLSRDLADSFWLSGTEVTECIHYIFPSSRVSAAGVGRQLGKMGFDSKSKKHNSYRIYKLMVKNDNLLQSLVKSGLRRDFTSFGNYDKDGKWIKRGL